MRAASSDVDGATDSLYTHKFITTFLEQLRLRSLLRKCVASIADEELKTISIDAFNDVVTDACALLSLVHVKSDVDIFADVMRLDIVHRHLRSQVLELRLQALDDLHELCVLVQRQYPHSDTHFRTIIETTARTAISAGTR